MISNVLFVPYVYSSVFWTLNHLDIMNKVTAFSITILLASTQLVVGQDAWVWQGTTAEWTGAGGCSLEAGPDFFGC